MEKLGMGALLAVTKASPEPAKLIVLHYDGGPRNKTRGSGRQGHHLRHGRHLAEAVARRWTR